MLKLPPSSFRYLHVRLSSGILPQQVKSASIANLREQQASWTKAGSCAAPRAKQRTTEIACEILPKVPLNRILFRVEPAQVNFRRTVSVEDSKGNQIASGEITRVRVNRAGTLIINEDLAVSVSVVNISGLNGGDENSRNPLRLTLIIDNGDNPPLTVVAAEPLALERRVYFDPQGKSALRLYYGDERLAAPVYDYARFFHLDASATQAQPGPGAHNTQYTGRPDERPWSERHKAVLWAAMILAAPGMPPASVTRGRDKNGARSPGGMLEIASPSRLSTRIEGDKRTSGRGPTLRCARERRHSPLTLSSAMTSPG